MEDVFLPLQPHFLALHGLSKLMQTVGLVASRLNDRLRMAGVVLCLYESGTRLANEVASDVDDYFSRLRDEGPVWQHVRLFSSRVRRNIRLAEAPSFGQSIFGYDATSAGASDYQALTSEVLSLLRRASPVGNDNRPEPSPSRAGGSPPCGIGKLDLFGMVGL